MSASGPCNMRGPRPRTPLFVFVLLLTALTTTVFCQSEDEPELEPPLEEDLAADLESVGDVNPVTSGPDTTDPGGATTSVPPITDGTGAETGSGHNLDTGLPETDVSGTTANAGVTGPTSVPQQYEGLNPIILLIPVVLVVLIIAMIVCGIFINRRWNNKARNQELRKEDPYLDGSSTEKVPMPMFEEDVPSVLELEMEELEDWMKKDGDTTEDSKQA